MGKKRLGVITVYLTSATTGILTHPVYAATASTVAGVSNIESFIKSVILVLTSIAGLIAVAFIVIGGIGYITSSGNPEHLDKSKRTLIFSGLGLSISIGAFVIGNIVTTLATNAFGN